MLKVKSCAPVRVASACLCVTAFLLAGNFACGLHGQSALPELNYEPGGGGFTAPAILQEQQPTRFQWRKAFEESTIFLAVEHGFRLAYDPKVRQGLRGPFFADYFASVRNIHGWSDGDGVFTNYFGHPFSGSIAAFIGSHNDPSFRNAEFGRSGEYWRGVLRAMGYSAISSLQFEIGPVSEASIGNIQLDPRKRGVVDWVITPTMGTAWMVGEDFVDDRLIRAIERRTHRRAVVALARTFLNPTRSSENLLGRRAPWHRDNRPGINRLYTTAER